jgi:geranylgeranyl diphosphate synthase type II
LKHRPDAPPSTEGGASPSALANPLAGRLAAWAEEVERRLPALLPPADTRPERVHAAMHYALTTPGKRLRPVLTLAVAELFGGIRAEVLDLACAVEMVHASSLVLDDLPAMDDAALRRGRPTLHRAYAEDVALLAAFGLLSRAYALVAEVGSALRLRRYAPADLAHHLAAAVGTDGLIGGQALDLEQPESPNITLERLEYIHSHKTGALFLAAAELGAMAADARRKDLDVVSRYAKNLGLAFQISDDLLDVLATPEETGKDAHQDAGKVTFVTLLGVEGARALEGELLGFAVDALAPLGKKAEALRGLAHFVRVRRR